MFLDKKTFSFVIENTPLVSIDLVVKNEQGQALLGERLNRPAKGFWFVPGGRILKDESMAKAFQRLTLDELGQEFSIEQADFLAAFDHFYDDNVFGSEYSTHYVALAYELILKQPLKKLPLNMQHKSYQWFSVDSLLLQDNVHQHTKNYFI